VLVTINLLKI